MNIYIYIYIEFKMCLYFLFACIEDENKFNFSFRKAQFPKVIFQSMGHERHMVFLFSYFD
jgi:hypothetical protein